MSHSTKELKKDFNPSLNRIWYNKWVKKNAKGNVLDVGKSKFWDYGFPTIDNNPEMEPTFLGNIEETNFPDETYDMVLCNGMYEFVTRPQMMVDECMRILKKGGIAIFGLAGKGFWPQDKGWNFYEPGDIKFTEVKDKKDFQNYHFIICQKYCSPEEKDLLEDTSKKE